MIGLLSAGLFPQIATPAPALAVTTPSVATVGPFTFEVGPYELNRLPIERLTDYGTTVVTCPNTDSQGVAMYRASDGLIHDHPVAQARCAAYMLRNYWLTDDPVYLERAINNGDRILSYAEMHGSAMFFPYSFNVSNPGRSYLTAPWYSAMAQGLGLSAFVRLHEWTGDAKWMDAAHRTFASFKVARAPGKPWVVGVENGRLWLDEYPTVPLDRVFNGHNFSTFGLYDYWRVTDNAEARLLALGAMYSSYTVGLSAVRVPGGISQYCASQACLDRKVRNPAYHITHINQMLSLHRMTRHWHFASLAEAFIADAPRPYAGRVTLAAGTHAGYDFDADPDGVMVRTANLSGATKVNFGRRDVPAGRTHPGNGIWMRLTEGPLSGLWVRESSQAVPLGFLDTLDFYWNRSVRVAAGSYVGHTYDAAAQPTSSSHASTPVATWSYTNVNRINGRPSILLTSGPLAGHWLALDRRTTRDSTLFTDVDSSIFRNDIIWLNDQAITRGCSTSRYCPEAGVTREQMASFLVRGLELPGTSRDYFRDDETSQHASDINRLAAADVTAGCGPGRYCPRNGVTRAQMASFLVRALDLPAASRDHFTDDDRSPHEGDINRLAEAGVTGGCADGRFCPTSGVTRGQMAAFLRRALFDAAGRSAAAEQDPASNQASPSPTETTAPAPSASAQPEATPSPTPSGTVPPTPSASAGPEATPSPTPASTATPSPSPSAGEGGGPSASPAPSP